MNSIKRKRRYFSGKGAIYVLCLLIIGHMTALEASSRACPEESLLEVKTADQPGDLNQLQRLEKKIRQESLAFLSLVQSMRPEMSSENQLRSKDMAKVVMAGCRVYEVMDENSRVIYAPRINEEFEILDRNDNFYKVLLPDGRSGWILENSIQLFSLQKEEANVKFKGVRPSEIKNYADTVEEIFSRIVYHKNAADQIFEKYSKAEKEEDAGVSEICAVYHIIKRYYTYAQYFYSKYGGSAIVSAQEASFASKISAWTELLWGTSSYESQGASSPAERNKGSTRNISLGQSLALSESSTVDLSFSNKKDIIQTPYSTTEVQAGYSYLRKDKIFLSAGINYYAYGDEINDLNSFNQLALRTSTDLRLSAKSNIRFDYAFFNYNFSQNEENSYSNHIFTAEANLKINPLSRFSLQCRSNFESSETSFHKFTNIEPSLAYEKSKEDTHLQLRLSYDMLSFSELKLKSFSRAALQFKRSKRQARSFKVTDLSLIYKDFPNNDLTTYTEIRARYSSSRSGRFSRLFSTSVNTNLYLNNSRNNYSELRLDFGGNSLAFFTNFSTYFRFWHKPGEEALKESVKPHVLDLYLKLGLDFHFLRIGPSLGMHGLISSEKGVELIKRDGNLLRVGGIVEGRLPIPAKGSLSFSGCYEYGFVYNNEIEVDSFSGKITTGDIVQRHPTTLQVNGLLSIPLFNSFEFIGQANFYRIATKMDEKISINPVTQNDRLTLLFGLRYRYN